MDLLEVTPEGFKVKNVAAMMFATILRGFSR